MKVPPFFFKLILTLILTIQISACAQIQWGKLTKQGELLRLSGEHEHALIVEKEALEVAEKLFSPDDPRVALSLNNLAFEYLMLDQYTHAEALFKRSLAIVEKVRGPDHPDIALRLNNLGLLYSIQGQYERVEPLYKRSLVIWEKSYGSNHSRVAISLNNLARLYHYLGQYAKAESLYKRSLAIKEKTVGPNHSDFARGLSNLAALYEHLGQYAKAEPLFKRSLAIVDKARGSNHPEVALYLNNLAYVYKSQGQYIQAESLYKRSLTIREDAFGPNHTSMATSLSDLAVLYQAQGQYAQAEPLLKRSFAIREKIFGQDHPLVAESLSLSSVYSWLTDDMAKALTQLQRAIAIREHYLALFLVRGSEEEKRTYMATIEDDIHQAISLQLAAGQGNQDVTPLALTTVLQRKGRVLDAISGSVASLRQRMNEQDRMLLDQLAAIRNQQSKLYNQAQQGKIIPEQYHSETTKLAKDAQTLEAKISSHSAEFKTKSQSITLTEIQQAIPKGAALVEFAVYRPFNPKAQKKEDKLGAPHYIAYVLRLESEPLSVELGEAADIDSKISKLRNALADPSSDKVFNLARKLDEQLMQPVRQLLGKTRIVFISPDGALNLLPFGALVDENNQYLIKRYSFTYLSSGRDLLRFQAKVESKEQSTIIADIDYGKMGDPLQSAKGDLDTANRRSSDLRSVKYTPLPGTAIEADEIRKILLTAKVLKGQAATEGAFKQLNSPHILHVATHGFFLSDQLPKFQDRHGLQSQDDSIQIPSTENPLLRSGLALANANQLASAGEDGVLTALEVSGLNLWGTRLVVLSACETGLGDVKNGEGVFGLRRALVIAGAENQLLSLWNVDDLATKDLMVDYYRRLVSKEGRSEALRQAQLAMLSDSKRQHPFYWASFIASGDWRPLD